MADEGLRRRVPPTSEENADEGKGVGDASPSGTSASAQVASAKNGTKDEDDKTAKAKRQRSKNQPPPLRWDEIASMAMTVFTAAVTVASTYYIVQQMRHRADVKKSSSAASDFDNPAARSLNPPGTEKLFTAEELSKFDGSDPNLPLLLGCIGEVFDVTAGKKHYGKGEGYNHFCGRDASRAFVSGNFSGDGLTDDLSKLSYDNLIGVAGWRDFYHKTYKYVGRLVGTYFNETGLPTRNLTRFERHLNRAQAEKEKQKEEDKKYVGCNSYWSAKDGGRVYCDKGYPRMAFSVMATGHGQSTQRTRCICLGDDEIGVRPDLKEYDNCEPWSQTCQTSPPEATQ